MSGSLPVFPSDSTALASALCVRCGLCCDGSIFSLVPMLDEEEPLVLSLGLSVQQHGEQKTFRLPCPQLHERCCQVYEQRPSRCRAFSCDMLKEYLQGSLTLQECESRIDSVQALIALYEKDKLRSLGITVVSTSDPDYAEAMVILRAFARYRLLDEGHRVLIHKALHGTEEKTESSSG